MVQSNFSSTTSTSRIFTSILLLTVHLKSDLVATGFFVPSTHLRNQASITQLPTKKRSSTSSSSTRSGQLSSASMKRDEIQKRNIGAQIKSSSTAITATSSNGSNEENGSNIKKDMGILSLLGFVLPLLLVYISNQWSRASIYYLVDFSSSTSSSVDAVTTTPSSDAASALIQDPSYYAMNLDIGFNQAQYGALASVAFTSLFAITSLFAGSLADKYNRKYLSIGSTIIWSIATYTTSTATSYNEVVLSRIIMGLACAFTTPCAYTFIKDTVADAKLSFANSLYGSGVYFGGGLSSLSILLDNNFGWRDTMEIISLYGFAVALLTTLALPNDPKQISSDGIIITTPSSTTSAVKKTEKAQHQSENNEPGSSFFSNVQDVLSTNKRIQWLFLGSFLRFCSGLCIGVWAAPYYKAAFPNDANSYAVINALIVGLCGVTSGLLGGYLSDKARSIVQSDTNESEDRVLNNQFSSSSSFLSNLDENGARLIVPIVGSILAVPTWWLTCHASTFDTAMIWLATEYLVAECWFGPTVAVLQSEVKKGQGGVAQGLFTLTGAIGNLAPSVLGVLYSQQMGGDVISGNEVLSNLLGVGVCSGYLLSAVCFGLSATTPTTPKKNITKSL